MSGWRSDREGMERRRQGRGGWVKGGLGVVRSEEGGGGRLFISLTQKRKKKNPHLAK